MSSLCYTARVLYDREFCHRRPGEISYPSDIYRRSRNCPNDGLQSDLVNDLLIISTFAKFSGVRKLCLYKGVCSGVIRGVGMQRTGAIVCIVCMYLIGGPMGLGLLMMTDLSVSGFWWGLCAGTGLEAVVYSAIIMRIDWEKMCRKAAKRTEIRFIDRSSKRLEVEIKEQDGGEGTPHEDSSRGDGKVEACTPTVLCTRAALIVFCISTIVVALVCRFVLDWRAHFRSYCLLNNGTLLQVDPSEAVQANNQCLRILP
ncbi:Multidrug and toxin extrusion protein 1 [Taenia solium]|eukprot:TsM_001017000 transcript=TsM_001017000 gene=TsM_001017000